MKKCLILVLVLTLALMLTACGASEPETGKVEPVTTQAPETLPPETQAVETEAPVEENPLALGRMEGGTYTNTYAGFGCDLDESWEFYSAAELQELPGAVQESMEGSELGDQLDGFTQVMDMKAENVDAMVNVNVLYTKLDMTSRLAFQMLTEEQIIDATLEQKDQMAEAYAQAGMENAVIEKVQVTFLGQEHWAMKTSAQVQGVNYYILQIMDYKVGAYGVTLSAGSFVEDNTQAVLDLFYPVA